MAIAVRYFAAAAAAAGTASETREATTLGDLLGELVEHHGEEFARVLGRCSVLIDGRRTDDRSTPLNNATTVDLLPPFAGG